MNVSYPALPVLIVALLLTTSTASATTPTCDPLDLSVIGGGTVEVCGDSPDFTSALAGGRLSGLWSVRDGGYQLDGTFTDLALDTVADSFGADLNGSASGTFSFRYDRAMELEGGTVNWSASDVVADPIRIDVGLGLTAGTVTPTSLGDVSGVLDVDGSTATIRSLRASGGDVELSIDDGQVTTARRWNRSRLDLVVRAAMAPAWLEANGLTALLEALPMLAEACDGNVCSLRVNGSVRRPGISAAP